jgi:hypothetical protein
MLSILGAISTGPDVASLALKTLPHADMVDDFFGTPSTDETPTVSNKHTPTGPNKYAALEASAPAPRRALRPELAHPRFARYMRPRYLELAA